ncbi:TPA: DNA polymerase III subunit gamma/tau [Candidatus Dependentiae bacterium]|nr:MAG: polymerase III subunit gamma/tau protein [candidate division TM6 bacterium GW2011_GWE2_31_21]KKP52925.1 MAG: polymerase III subunit gamma/tau protein [candidate division TM6 bacterium GW2011_GWF2_33_332]HBS47834.1 DNA polymerase III subunit gamma/tau [Candidatus Dependentiae bacterium]HBZ73190.1 DNA polymerase III subunit gamma/tau [Candidatus Dependentiae bacterium]
MQNLELNLARKLRPKTFNDVIGQELSVRILKNGLYLNKFFPVYIFSGNRGCGKTTSARLLAAAVNCENLKNFQQNPKEQDVPCGKCSSCNLMLGLNHPDFIEIDAASHTGVDNVRQILESATYLPLLGNKKIYLIDEAHMLSKAAFNAFLKILEEPPVSVIFVLATTEIYKIPETVRSRAFQLFFNGVNSSSLSDYLKIVCKDEAIVIEEEVIDLIVSQTDGSVRDAINLLERVRLSSSSVTLEDALKLLGKIGYEELIDLFEIVLNGDERELIVYLDKISFENLAPQSVWDMLIVLCRSLVWIKFGISSKSLKVFDKYSAKLKKIAESKSVHLLNEILQQFWLQEEIFAKTSNKSIFLESFLLQLCMQDFAKNLSSKKIPSSYNSFDEKKNSFSQNLVKENKEEIKAVAKEVKVDALPENKTEFHSFITEKLSEISDLLLVSILRQAKDLDFDKEKGVLKMAFLGQTSFFKNKLEESKSLLLPLIKQFSPQTNDFIFSFLELKASEVEKKKSENLEPLNKKIENIQRNDIPQKPKYDNQKYSQGYKVFNKSKNIEVGKVVDISDESKWPKSNLLVKFFSGRIEKRQSN